MITVKKASKENWDQLVKLFELSPECNDCWCMNHRSEPKGCPNGEKAKTALHGEILSGRAPGLLAFTNNVPVGWCAIDLVKTQIGHDYNLRNPSENLASTWMIHCLYIDPAHRGVGISGQLIETAVAMAKDEGASEVLAFPIPADSMAKFPKDVGEFSGRLSTFLRVGFASKERLNDFYQVVAKTLF